MSHTFPWRGIALLLLLTGCAPHPPKAERATYLFAEYSPPTVDLAHVVPPGPSHTFWRQDGDLHHFVFPHSVAVACDRPPTCRHAAVLARLSLRAQVERSGRTRIQGELVSTVGRQVVDEFTTGSSSQRSVHTIDERVEVIAEGRFVTPIEATFALGETLDVPGFRGATLRLRLQVDSAFPAPAPR